MSTNRCRDANLSSDGGNDGLGVHEVGVAEVVEAAGGEDLGAGLEPDRLAKGNIRIPGQQLGGQDTEGAQHGPARVDQLRLPVPANPHSPSDIRGLGSVRLLGPVGR